MAKGAGKRTSPSVKANGGGNISFEAKLWAAADALGNNMDAAEYRRAECDALHPKLISGELRIRDVERITEST